MSILKITNLEAAYDTLKILHGVDMEVEEGEFAAIVGPNGCGKSTTLRCITGLLKPQKGRVKFQNTDITGQPVNRIVQRGIVLVPQGRQVLHDLTVEDNLEIGGWLVSNSKELAQRMDRVFKTFPALKQHRKRQATDLSGGQQQMLAIGRALMLEPKMLILDEPSLGLAPKSIEEIFEKIIEINKSGVTILMVEQNVKLALKVSSKMFVLQSGKTVFSGKPEELSEKKLSELYFGG